MRCVCLRFSALDLTTALCQLMSMCSWGTTALLSNLDEQTAFNHGKPPPQSTCDVNKFNVLSQKHSPIQATDSACQVSQATQRIRVSCPSVIAFLWFKKIKQTNKTSDLQYFLINCGSFERIPRSWHRSMLRQDILKRRGDVINSKNRGLIIQRQWHTKKQARHKLVVYSAKQTWKHTHQSFRQMKNRIHGSDAGAQWRLRRQSHHKYCAVCK